MRRTGTIRRIALGCAVSSLGFLSNSLKELVPFGKYDGDPSTSACGGRPSDYRDRTAGGTLACAGAT
jgi:hypothetical protein